MSTPSPSMRELARRLLAANRESSPAVPASETGVGRPSVHEAVAVCEILRVSLTRFAGADGFTALMRRALALARVEAPALQNVKLGANCHLENIEEVDAEAAVALAAHLLTLLVTFIGESLTLHLVGEAWPDVFPDDERNKN